MKRQKNIEKELQTLRELDLIRPFEQQAILSAHQKDIDEIYEDEERLLNILDDMCAHSLDPENGDKWDDVKEVLINTRRKLKHLREGN